MPVLELIFKTLSKKYITEALGKENNITVSRWCEQNKRYD